MDKRLLEIQSRKAEIRKALEKADAEQLKKFEAELQELNKEAAEIEQRNKIAAMLEEKNKETRKAKKQECKEEMNFDSIEYRKAFMNYVVNGTDIPAEFRDVSKSTDNAAVIPTVVLDKIITKMEQYGDILARVNRINYPAGVVVPTSATKVTAVWRNEGDNNTVNNVTTGSIIFAAYELSCATGVSFKMSIQSLQAFEDLLIKNVSKAMIMALEAAIINGTGSGQLKGILKETPAKTVELGAKLDYKTLVSFIKSVPAAYKKDTSFIMNEDTFYDLLAITDNNGQPVARTTIGLDGAANNRLFGKEVIFTDQIKSLDTASGGETVAVAFNLNDYVLNTSYEMDLITYVDNPTRNKVYDSVMLVDGKVVDTNGLVFFNKAAE